MERLRRRRNANRVIPNRDSRRKNVKRIRRKVMVENKIKDLLRHCPDSILTTDILSKEQIDILKNLIGLVDYPDYYPVPKRIHNSIRSYAHSHKVQRGQSLLLALSFSGLGIAYQINNVPTYEGEFSLERIENCLRELEEVANRRTAVRDSTFNRPASGLTMDWAAALRNSEIHLDTESVGIPL